MDANRKMGTVKWFSRIKGYGFIAPDDQEKEIFVHYSGIEGEGYRNLEKGQRVSFAVEDTAKGPQAVAVREQAADVREVAGGMSYDSEPAREYNDLDEDMDEEPPDLIA
jgi:CspA family cold shock protein